jgi:predicted AAA+ superfamily ATPase
MVGQLTGQLPFETQFASADDVPAADRIWIRNTWDEARMKLAHSGGKEFLLVIDEIQKVDNWSEVVKREWDTDTREGRNLKVIILGSSQLLIQKGLTESLAGRFEMLYLTHWTFSEMKQAFGWSVDQYIWFGGYPGSARLMEDELRWKTYIKDSLIETSISRDILMLTRVDKPALLKRLFEIGCSYTSQIVSLNKVQGELQEKGNLTTLANYLRLLEGAGLLTGIEKFSADIIRKRSSKPKFQVFNNALISAQSYLTFQRIRSDHKAWGRIVESAVGAHLLNSSFDKKFRLHYWNENNNEVDFVMEMNGKLVAIEVKSGNDSRNRGMAIFEGMYHPAHLITVGTRGIPAEEFLSYEPAELFAM